jgi:hypothetical protein
LGQRQVGEGTLDLADVKRLLVTDSAAEAVAGIRDVAMSRFALTYGPRARRR